MKARARTRAILVTVGLACLVVVLNACRPPVVNVGRISILPSAAVAGQSWAWSPACPYAPHAVSGCDAAGPEVGTAQLAGNEWNLGVAQGSDQASDQGSDQAVNMSVGPAGALHLGANLASAPACTEANCLARQANTWVRGFPSVLYGIDQCHAQTAPSQSPKLSLPARVDSIPSDLVGRASYNAKAAQATYDVAYDLWLNKSDTNTPCQTDGTLEVMIWTDYNKQALLPDSLKVETASIPYAVNGVIKAGTNAWTVYVSNIFGGGHTQPWGGTVWVVPNAANTTSKGAVSIDISDTLSAVSTLLTKYDWGPVESTYWLDTIAFGMEYGPQNADPYGDGPSDFSLALSSYCLSTGATVANATC